MIIINNINFFPNRSTRLTKYRRKYYGSQYTQRTRSIKLDYYLLF